MMLAWIVLLSTLFNFTYGLLLPVIPRLGIETAGIAFSSFTLIKILVMLPGGYFSDRVGHWRTLGLAVAIQLLGLIVIWQAPQVVWVGRGLEGIALALAQVSAISLCRTSITKKEEFGKAISKVMGIGSIGFLIGPITGFFLVEKGVDKPLIFGAGLTALFLVTHLILTPLISQRAKRALEMPTESSNENFHWKNQIYFMLALGCGKALGVGMEPLFAWWSTDVFHFSPSLSGLTFVVMAVTFALGNFLPRRHLTPLVLIAVVLLELSLKGQTSLWWPCLALIGYWSGTILSLSISELGWNKPESIGASNSIWLVATDLPMALTPVLVWELRDPAAIVGRESIVLLFVFLATGGLLWGFRQLEKRKA